MRHKPPPTLLQLLTNAVPSKSRTRFAPFFILPSTSQFSTTQPRPQQPNRLLPPIRIPPTFHDYLRQASANNTLLLLLFTVSACAPCRTITPLLEDIVRSRPTQPQDKFSALSFAEVELDSPDNSNGNMMDLGVEWGVTSMPTLMGFGGRRAERLTERLVDTRLMGDKRRVGEWIDEAMKKGGDGEGGGGGGGSGTGGLLGKLFG